MTSRPTAIGQSPGHPGTGRWLATALLLVYALLFAAQPVRAAGEEKISKDELQAIADEAYIYAYPLLVMELSRRVQTNVEKASATGSAPVNQFAHLTTPPAAGSMQANPYALSSSLWFDVTKEPLVVSLPAAGERHYLVNVVDLWGDVVAAVTPRTTGRAAVNFAILGPRWKGKLPTNVLEIVSTTNSGWLTLQLPSKTRTDAQAQVAFQQRVMAVPLNRYGRSYTAAPAVVDPQRDMSAPLTQVEQLPGASWYSLFASLLPGNPPHPNDYPMLLQLRRIGLDPNAALDLTLVDPGVIAALAAAPERALPRIRKATESLGPQANGWTVQRPPLGTYGTDYLRRAAVARIDPGASLTQDLLRATVRVDSDGRALDADKRYTLHFSKEQLPAAQALWSLTVYDGGLRLVDNPLGRYALGSRDGLKYNGDGTLDLYLQRDEPEAELQSNWLPTPTAGSFSLYLRWYWPLVARVPGVAGPTTQDGGWKPPSVVAIAD